MTKFVPSFRQPPVLARHAQRRPSRPCSRLLCVQHGGGASERMTDGTIIRDMLDELGDRTATRSRATKWRGRHARVGGARDGAVNILLSTGRWIVVRSFWRLAGGREHFKFCPPAARSLYPHVLEARIAKRLKEEGLNSSPFVKLTREKAPLSPPMNKQDVEQRNFPEDEEEDFDSFIDKQRQSYLYLLKGAVALLLFISGAGVVLQLLVDGVDDVEPELLPPPTMAASLIVPRHHIRNHHRRSQR